MTKNELKIVEELKELLKLKDQRIKELEAVIKLLKDKLEQPVLIKNDPIVIPYTIPYPYPFAYQCAQAGCIFPNPWFGITPPQCTRCGKYSQSSIVVTYATNTAKLEGYNHFTNGKLND